jgi:hypothetical protein
MTRLRFTRLPWGPFSDQRNSHASDPSERFFVTRLPCCIFILLEPPLAIERNRCPIRGEKISRSRSLLIRMVRAREGCELPCGGSSLLATLNVQIWMSAPKEESICQIDVLTTKSRKVRDRYRQSGTARAPRRPLHTNRSPLATGRPWPSVVAHEVANPPSAADDRRCGRQPNRSARASSGEIVVRIARTVLPLVGSR